ncbi:MAG TPA: membrane protein insertase YidC [Rhodospirillaceae bacterium]|nr:membrane protein insertase YidC [Rhodospirillaceae bacterium]MBB56661.1 membrane protein insertase YidC [Rhodospirillaceae bacterium]HBM14192.1 membrane protein insertase YidC [Rhodospirillaceae bacterium]|tara:strand:+ start:15748 stop:17763 length:2016 start_codon:yes stop_codon:yes gene_type:complete
MNENNRNLALAIGLSMLVLFGWPFLQAHFFPAPPKPVQTQSSSSGTSSSTTGEQAGIPGVPGTGDANSNGIMSRDEALTQSPRITINTPRLRGSLNLKGARLDDLILNDYRQTIEDSSPNIDLLQPTGSVNPYFAQFGWTGEAGLEVPNSDTIWTADRQQLDIGQPVTLSWTNAAGVRFEQVISLDQNFMFTVDQRVINNSGDTISATPYGRIFRGDQPETLGFYILHEGLIGVFDGALQERNYDDMPDEPGMKESFTTTGGWMGITDKYWLVALVPDQQDTVTGTFRQTGTADPQYHVNYITTPQAIAPGDTMERTGRVFAGAKETTLLDSYSESLNITNFDLAVDFGWFYFLTKPIFYVIHWLNSVLGNFGLAIIGMTTLFKIFLFPLAQKSYKSMSKMKLLQPKIVEMRDRAGDDKQKLQQEMMALYKKEKVNPLAGCLPVLVQIPIFFSLYKVLFVTIEMRHAPFFGWIHDLSAPDPLGMLTLFGLVPWDVPTLLHIVNIGPWPLIMGFTMWFQQKLNPPPADPIQAKIFGLMPIFFTFILGGFPAGLVIYWAWNNSLSILQQYVIMRQMGVAIGGGKIETSDSSEGAKSVASKSTSTKAISDDSESKAAAKASPAKEPAAKDPGVKKATGKKAAGKKASGRKAGVKKARGKNAPTAKPSNDDSAGD